MKESYHMSEKMEKSVKDYQPSQSEFAGKQMGKANDYIARTEKTMNKAASKVKGQAHMGRYD
tara:strand:- start:496 stop:681 length:186 start_codon:yes stop_codon:yes gene_type:complete